ncbi:MAG TPA: hypothetical protein VM219_08215 [Phycisphaerae bacterium]|nr:hypothetical protein [Phycisphaerae bacterium]
MAASNDYLPFRPKMKESWFSTIPTVVSVAVVIVMMYFGGLVLHIWTSALFWDRWGPFWGVIAFCSPVFAEAVAAFACFWWHVWYYVLAIALWLASMGAMAFTEEGPALRFRSALFIGWICLIGVLSVGLGHYAWRYSLGPTSPTANDRAQLEDCALAVVASIHASASDDPSALADLVTAKESLKDTIQGYDRVSLDELCAIVNEYLRFERSLQNDLQAYMEELSRTGKASKFTVSERTRQIVDKLPNNLRTRIVTGDLMQMERLSGDASILPENWRVILDKGTARIWTIYGQTYSELLGRPMPQ